MNRLNLILLLALLVALGLWVKSYESHKATENLLYAIQDTLRVTKDKNDVQTASIAVLEGSNKDLLKDVRSKDSTILRLQATVKKYKRDLAAATSIDIVTKESVSGKDTIIKSDTVIKEGKVFVYPVYQAVIKRLYSTYTVTAGKDSIHVDAEIKNKLDVNWVYQRELNLKGVEKKWGPKHLVAQVKTYNHNTSTEQMHSYRPTELVDKKIGKWVERIIIFASGWELKSLITNNSK